MGKNIAIERQMGACLSAVLMHYYSCLTVKLSSASDNESVIVPLLCLHYKMLLCFYTEFQPVISLIMAIRTLSLIDSSTVYDFVNLHINIL